MYDLQPLLENDEKPTHVPVSTTIEGFTLKEGMRLDSWENFVFINNGTDVLVYMLTIEFGEAAMEELLTIREETIDYDFNRIDPIVWSDFSVIGFTEHLALLLVYEEGERGLFTFSLTDELSQSAEELKEKESWKILYSPDDNHFGGSTGTNYMATSS